MQRVAALEHRRAGELGVGDLVIVEAAFLEQLVARPNPIAVVPPFLAAENQVRAGNLADAGRLTAVSEVQRNRHRLRRDQAAEFRSEEHTSELQSLMRISYAVLCLKKKKNKTH